MTLYRVLLVDDEAPFVESLASLPWDAHGCGLVGTAFNGEEALAKCDALMPDIIITDIAMPLMDGITLMEQVLRRHPDMQFILLTVHKSFDYALQAIQAGALDYIVKDMHLRSNLPLSLDKAVKRLSLLRGHTSPAVRPDILRLDAGTEPRLHLPLLAPVLGRFGGTLATLRLFPPLSNEDALEAFIRSACKGLLPHAGCVQWGAACFELLLPSDSAPCQDVLRSVRRAADSLLSPGQALSAAYAPLGPAAEAYPAAHEANVAALDLMFYHPQPCAVPADGRRCAALPKALADAWIDTLSGLRANIDDIAAYITGPLADLARAEQFAPTALKQAYLRMLHGYEMHYAESAQLDARKAIVEAQSLDALTRSLLGGIRAVVPGGNAYSYIVSAALKYLGEHFANPTLQLSDVADSVCISPGHLSRRLKEETGKSFQELLMQLRMETATRLLRHTPDKVYAVAEKVGYQNYRTFVNAFVHYYGVRPKAFR